MTRASGSKSGPPARPGFMAVVMIAASSMYSQNASKGPTIDTWPRGALALLLARAGEQEDRAGRDARALPRSAGRAQRRAVDAEEGEAGLVVDGDTARAPRARPSHSRDLRLGRAEHEVVGGEDVVGGPPRPPAPIRSSPSTARRGMRPGISLRRKTSEAAAERGMETRRVHGALGRRIIETSARRAARRSHHDGAADAWPGGARRRGPPSRSARPPRGGRAPSTATSSPT